MPTETTLRDLAAGIVSCLAVADVAVTKTGDSMFLQQWTLTFQGDLAGTDVPQVTVDTSNISGMSVTDIEETDTEGGGTGADEVQEITLSNSNAGTFRLAFLGETTPPLPHDATAGQVKSALEELHAIDELTVSGSAGGPWTVTFVGNHSGLDQPKLNGDAASLTSGTEVREISYSFDTAGQLVAVSDPDSSYAYEYDALGRVLTVDNDGTPGVPRVILTSAYDAASNRTSLSADVGGTPDFLNEYSYDALHRLVRVDQVGQFGGNDVAPKRVDLAYNAAGQWTEIARYNDTAGGSANEVATSVYSYDGVGRLIELAHQQDSTNLFTPYEWTFDDLGRITQFVSQDGTSDYEYDATSQLTSAEHSYQGDETYSYDLAGNRTMTGYVTGDNNQLLEDGTYVYEYDAEGNRTRREHDSTGEVTQYEWDFRNRLVRVTERDEHDAITQVVEFIYDVFDRRIGKLVDTTSPFDMVDAVIERYVYDDASGVASLAGGNVVLDFVDPDGDGQAPMELTARQLYGAAVDQILAKEDLAEGLSDPERVLWHLADHLGTTRDLVDHEGVLVEHYEYDSFGNVVSGDTSLTRYLFTGREWDADVDLQYSRARWYDPSVGRWISEDPIGFAAGDVNLARYVGNLATGATDPSGLRTEQIYVDGFIAPLSQENDADVFQFMDSMQPATGGNTWSDGDLLDWSAAYFAGMGDALTLEGTMYIRETLGINGGVDATSGIYVAGNLTGTAINVYLTGGAGLARTPAVARTIARVYTTTDIAVARVQWGHRVLTGQATVMDALPLARLLRGSGSIGYTLGVAPGRTVPSNPGRPFPSGARPGQTLSDIDPNTLQAGRGDIVADRLADQQDLIQQGIPRTTPIKGTPNGVIWDGNHGARAAAEAGVPVIVQVVRGIVTPRGSITDIPIRP